jgi:hypothetical protein
LETSTLGKNPKILLGISAKHMSSYEVEINSSPGHVCRLSYTM